MFFRCCAMELVSERCIVNLLDRGVEVKPAYILRTFKLIYNISFLQNTNRGGRIMINDEVGSFNLL